MRGQFTPYVACVDNVDRVALAAFGHGRIISLALCDEIVDSLWYGQSRRKRGSPITGHVARADEGAVGTITVTCSHGDLR